MREAATTAHPCPDPRSARGLYAYVRAHPLLAAAMITFALVVIVHFLTYIVLGAFALSAIKTRCGARM